MIYQGAMRIGIKTSAVMSKAMDTAAKASRFTVDDISEGHRLSNAPFFCDSRSVDFGNKRQFDINQMPCQRN